MKTKNNDKGFSLVELIVVIVILAILIGVTITGVMKYVTQARQNTDVQNCETLQSTLWEVIGMKSFPALGFPYSYVCISDANDGYENQFGYSFCLGETEGRYNYSLDGNKGHFQNAINECFTKRNTNKPRFTLLAFESKVNDRVFIVIAVGTDGSVKNVQVGTINGKLSISRGTCWELGVLYHPDIVIPESNKQYILGQISYDGVYKFYE